jgi:Flp pilus assembly protein TadD
LALEALKQAAALDPEDGRIHSARGQIFVGQKQFAAAVSEYEAAVRLAPQDAEAHADLGYALRLHNKVPAAEAAYRKAIDLQPNLARAHYNLGILLCDDKHNYAEAAEAFRKACRLSPEDAHAYSNLGIALCHLRQFKAAEVELREAIRLKADLANAHDMLGLALANQNRYREAVDAFRTAIRIEPRNAVSHYNLGKVLELREDWAGAVGCYEEALRRKSNYLPCCINLALLLTICPESKFRNADRALEVARQAVVLATRADRAMQLRAWQVLGCARYRKSDWKGSLEALEKAASLEGGPGGSAWQGFFLAMNHWQLGQHDKARQHYDRAVLWLKQHAPDHKQLRGIQAEAGALLKSKGG